MNILVTGGAGYIGSNLCKELSKNNKNKIYSLDNYFTGKTENHIKNVTYYTGNTSDIEKIIKIKIDLVYHLGEYSRLEQSFDDIKIVLNSNLTGTAAVLEFCRKNNCKLIYSASSSKFGEDGKSKNESPYAWTKATNTEIIKNYGSWYGLNYAITYFYNVYGKNEISEGKYSTVIALFKNKMKNKLPLTVVKPGTQLRNFTYIDDVISGLALVGEKGSGDNYGIGYIKSYSILDIANMFGGEIEYINERNGNRLSADLITSKTQELGWKPIVDIKDYINDLKNNNWIEKY